MLVLRSCEIEWKKQLNGLIGMVKYAAERSGSKYVIGREGWKTMILSRLLYGCGALAYGR